MTLFAAGFTFALLGINAVDKEASLVDVFFKMLPTIVFLDYPTTSNTHIALSKFLFLLAINSSGTLPDISPQNHPSTSKPR